jgi:hypothetical protein
MTRPNPKLLVVLAVALIVPLAAQAQDLFPQATSAETLRVASGLVWDATVLDEDPHWTFDGEWALSCRGAACQDATLENISFDMALTMVRPDGTTSHSHTFTDFVATSVSADAGVLTIEGTLQATGGIGFGPVTITLDRPDGQSTFLVEFVGNDHAVGPIGGVIVRSR